MNKEFSKKRISNKEKQESIKKAKEEFGVEVGEDSTKYGEFISSYFAWISLPNQKEKVKKLENMTNKDKCE